MAPPDNPQPLAPSVSFICGPDVTDQIATTWTQIQKDFTALRWGQKVSACNTILVPINAPSDPMKWIPFLWHLNIQQLLKQLPQLADINGWDTLPLYQGESQWLRAPPVYDRNTNGPCATPPGTPNDPKDPFDDGWENPDTCSDTVAVAGQCWLNGSVNYGTFGIMVRLCSDFAQGDPVLRDITPVKIIYSLGWALRLIEAYKSLRPDKDPTSLPAALAWTQATFLGGPHGVPTISGNRPKCKCTCACKGDVNSSWDYIWEPFRPRDKPYR